MKILVTGATGFIGRHLIARLVADGHEVLGLVRNPAKQAVVVDAGAKVALGDVTDFESVRKAIHNVDAVFHLASRVSDWGSWSEFESATVRGTENVLLAAAEGAVRRFVHMSSVAVYDDRVTCRESNVSEETPQGDHGDRTHGYYARAKVLAERRVAIRPQEPVGSRGLATCLGLWTG